MPSKTRTTRPRRSTQSDWSIDLHARNHFGVLAFLLSAGIFVFLSGGFAWVGVHALLVPDAFPEPTGVIMLTSAALAAFVAFAAVSNGRDETRANRRFRLVKARIRPRVVQPGEPVTCTVCLALSEQRSLADYRIVLLGQELERDTSSDDAIFFHSRELHRSDVVLAKDTPPVDPADELQHSVTLSVPAGAASTNSKGLLSIEWSVLVEVRFDDGLEWSADTTIQVVSAPLDTE